MGTAIYSGIMGLQNQQKKLDVIGNNIANVDTTGFKSSRVVFQDILSQTLTGPAPPQGGLGGRNPKQIGLGVQLASIDTIYTQGSLLTTGVGTDLAIEGDGFFILSDGTQNLYTRDGSFDLGIDGSLLDPATGYKVQGYLADDNGEIDSSSAATDLIIPIGGRSNANATSEIILNGNLDSGTATGETVTTTLQVYDSLGNTIDVQVTFTKTATANEWTYEAESPVGTPVGDGTITFDSDGQFVSLAPLSFADANINVPLTNGATTPLVITPDFEGMSQLAGDSLATLASQDGFPIGVLSSFSIGQGGVIAGIYSNGLTELLGQIALASFSNPGGLTREGNNLFAASINSGTPQVGISESGGRGSVTGGMLEGSNVDLSTEFVNLIIAQRSFQASARTITAADSILSEMVNLIR